VSAALVGSAPPPWRRYVPAVPAALTVAAAGGAFQRVFTWGDVLVPLILAVALGAAGGVAARQALGPARVPDPPGSEPSEPPEPPEPSQSEARTAVASVVAAAAVLAATLLSVVITAAVLATPRPATFGAAISRGAGSLFGGWSRILTTTVPVPPTPDRLPLFAGVVTIASAWAVLAASRRRPGVDALLPAGLVLLIGLLLGVHGPGSLAAVAGPALAVAAVYLLVVSRPAGEGVVWVPPGRIPAAISTGVVVLVVCLAAGAHLPLATLRQPVNLRAAVSPPVDLSNTPNPLDQLPAWQRENRTVMFTATVDRTWLQAPADWRLVSLNVYDGTGWSSDASATTAGNVLALPPGVSAGLLGPEVHVVVHMRALAAPWVPTTGVPTGVAPADLGFDPGSSDLVRPSGSISTFALSGRLPEPRRAALDAAGIGSGSSIVALTAVPGCFPATLRGLAGRVTAGLQRPDQQAVAIEQVLATKGGFGLNTSATPGSSCARLSAFASTRSGTEEQYSSAFALMVRSVGLPSRLAVGFTPGLIDTAGGQTVVTGSDATVWPEVELGPLGWVAFDPVPAASGRGGGGAGPATTVPVAQQGLNQVRQSVAANQSAPSVPGPPTSGLAPAPSGAASTGFPWVLVVVLALVAAAGLVVLGRILVRRHRRASRRAAPDPAERVLGAWNELLDSLAPFRVPVTSLTPTEVSSVATELAPPAGDATRNLAELVDQAVYAGVADENSASQAWASSDLAVHALAEAAPAGQRFRGLLAGSPRSPRR
jgi:transglutaminase-like putative cysteine protease